MSAEVALTSYKQVSFDAPRDRLQPYLLQTPRPTEKYMPTGLKIFSAPCRYPLETDGSYSPVPSNMRLYMQNLLYPTHQESYLCAADQIPQQIHPRSFGKAKKLTTFRDFSLCSLVDIRLFEFKGVEKI